MRRFSGAVTDFWSVEMYATQASWITADRAYPLHNHLKAQDSLSMVKQTASLWRRSTQQKPTFQKGENAMKYWVNTVLSLLIVTAMSPA